MEMVYPKHIYDESRREVAIDYVKHELKKMFPTMQEASSWKQMDEDVRGWFSDHEKLFFYPVRDFWNLVHGIMMGYKLKNQLLPYITAENVVWKKENINITDLTAGVVFEKEENLDEVKKHFALTEERLNDPIIVTQKQIDGVDKMVVYEGNGRLRLATLEGKTTMNAHVGRFTDARRDPENYWLPTSLLMEIVHFVKKAYTAKDEPTYQAYVAVLKDMLKMSESGKYEMKNRVISGPEELKNKLLGDLGL